MRVCPSAAPLLLVGLALVLDGRTGGAQITMRPPGHIITPNFFSIEISDGYGLDRNGNGIVDIPNTAAYVQRRLRTKLDFTGAALFMPAVWPLPEGTGPRLGKIEGPWRWTLTPLDVPQDETTLPAPPSSYSSAPGVNSGGTLVTFTQRPVLQVDLFEGAWKVEFARMNDGDLNGSPIYWVYADVVVEDYLIVQLGDSYSAGEGAAEKVSTQGIWADDGTGLHPRKPDYDKCIKVGLALKPSASLVSCLRREAFGSTENLHNELAHRSSRSWGSLVALEVERWGKASSVTFVNLASTGAEVRHLTQRKYADLPAIVPPPGLLPRLRAALPPSMVAAASVSPFGYDAADRARANMYVALTYAALMEALSEPLPPQLESLRALIGPRRVDALLMSFGGNDAGFSHAIAAYLIRDSDENDHYAVIEGALASGNWSEVARHSFEARHADWKFPSNLPGLAGLPAAYAGAAAALKAAGIAPENVYIIEYPDPLVAKTDRPKSSHADDAVDVCPGPILTAAGDSKFMGITIHNAKIGRGEQRHIRGAFIHPINNLIALSAEAHGWNVVGQVMQSMYRSPICSENRMVVRGVGQSADLQGDEWGTLHPNVKGHQAIAQLVGAHLYLPNIYRDTADYEDVLNPPGRNYASARPKHRLYSFRTETAPNTRREWLSVGLYPTSSRAFIEAYPSACSGGTFAVDAQAPHDYVYNNRRVVLEPWKIDNAVLRLLRWEESGQATEVARLTGFGTLTYSPTEADRGKKFTLVASTPRNADTEPRRLARVRGGPTRANEYGTFEIRARCPA